VKPSYGYSRSHRALEIVSIVVFFAALVSLACQTAEAVEGSNYRLPLGLSVLGGYVLSDILSGIAHWAGDTVGDEHTPFFGPRFVTPFRQHHVDPMAITRHDFIETNGNNCITSVPILAAMVWVMPRSPGWGLYLCVLLASAAFFVFCTNQFHKWAHAEYAPPLARWLQRNYIILSPQHHAIHHAAPHDKYYCITVGWMNPVLHHLHFFRACEAVVGWVVPSMLHVDERRRQAAD
jgi:ubiquitin-conjugating enzyme E2 variant